MSFATLKVSRTSLVCVIALLLMGAVAAHATLIPPYITGTINATLIVDDGGPHDGWHFYEMDIEWNLNGPGSGAGLSHWDLIFKSGCPIASDPLNFDLPAGYSTSEAEPENPYASEWLGFFLEGGDPSIDPLINPVIKYNEYTAEPGQSGYGTFSFYANTIPVYGTYSNALVAKAGLAADTYGDITGWAPNCTVPEPATIVLLGLGLGASVLLRRHR